MRTALVTLLAPFLVVAGCGGGGTQSVEKFDGVTITVRLPHGQKMVPKGKSAGGVHTWRSGDLEYVLDHMRLKVNGKDYGTMKEGDRVLIEAGAVTVNDQRREPVDAP